MICSGSTSLLVDCGFNRKHTLLRLQQLQFDPQNLSAVFVTHEHSDHAKGVVHVCETLQIPFYASYGTARQAKWLDHPLLKIIAGGEKVELGDMTVQAVTVPHDSVEPIQFVLNDKHFRLGILSDLGSITPHLIQAYDNCHGLMLEANHDVQLLQQGPYPPSLKRRVAGDFGHLNNQQALDLLQRLKTDQLQHFIATHISEKNNNITMVQQSFSQALSCAAKDVIFAEQDKCSDWFLLN